MPEPVLAFRVYAGSLCWHVKVFKHLRALRGYEVRLAGRAKALKVPAGTRLVAVHVGLTETRRCRGRSRLTPLVGELLFSRTHLGVNTVSHECFHATMAWARRRRIDVSRDTAKRGMRALPGYNPAVG